MNEKFEATLRAILSGTKTYKMTWDYLSDQYYDEAVAYYEQELAEEADVNVVFDSAFEAVYEDVLFVVACVDMEDERQQTEEMMYDLRIYAYEGAASAVDFASARLVFNSLDEQYGQLVADIYEVAAFSASGTDQLMDQIIAALGETAQ